MWEIYSSCSCPRQTSHVSCALNLPPTNQEWSASFFGFSLCSAYRDQFQVSPGELPRMQTKSCPPALRISINFENKSVNKGFFNFIIRLLPCCQNSYKNACKIYTVLSNWCRPRWKWNPRGHKKSILLSGILLFRYYNCSINAFQFYQRWKLNLSKYSDLNKNTTSNNLNISSMNEIRENTC